MNEIKCTSDSRERIAQLVAAYVKMDVLNEEGVARARSAIEAEHDANKAMFKLAVELAQDAFRSPRKYYFRPHVAPTHCLHLDVIDMPSLKSTLELSGSSAKALNAYFAKTLATPENVQFAFLTKEGSIGTMEEADDIFATFSKIGTLNGCEFGAHVTRLIKQCTSLWPKARNEEPETPVFGENVATGLLQCRAFAFLILGFSSLDFLQQLELCDLFQALESPRDTLVQMLSTVSAETLGGIVRIFEDFLSLQLLAGQQNNAQLLFAGDILTIFNAVNYLRDPRGLIAYHKFYNGTAVDFAFEDMTIDFKRFIENQESKSQKLFCFSSFPFLVDANFKSVILQLESTVEQQGALRQHVMQMLFSGHRGAPDQFFLVLNVERQRLMESTLRELNRKSHELQKPLRVRFVGEEGVDEGGVRKEFFQLLCKELLDPDYGMFFETEAHVLWIQPAIKNSTNKLEFHLVGQLLGLAVRNSVILDVAFPKVVFRKLLGRPVDFEDLKELDPGLAQGLQMLMEFEETEDLSVEDTFCRTFTYEHDVFGETVEAEIVPSGSQISLNSQNRQHFVDSMCSYVLEKCIDENFREFRTGFLSVCSHGLISSMQPEELELLVCGNPLLDFHELEKFTRYDGFSKTDPTIVNFWQIVHSMSLQEKKRFLKFCTGSDRVPIRGLKALGFVIGRNGDKDSQQLPTAHTCFNHLLLPPIPSMQKLREKLLLAIENCTGFGLI